MNHTFLHSLHAPRKNRFGEIRSWSKLSQDAVKILVLLTLVSCSHVFYQPIKGALFAPERVGLVPEEVWLKSADGTKIYAWVFRAKNPKGTILHFHGNAENMSSHFLNLAWIIKEGFDLLVFDYRGYGFSEGSPTQAGIHMDSLAALDWAFHDHEKRKTKYFIVYGQSLGGQISARALVDFPHQIQVNLLVQDSTFGSYQGIAAQKLGSRILLWPFYPLAYLAVSNEFASEKTMAQIKVPVLGIHATKDEVVPYELGVKNYEKIVAKKWWWRLPHGQHTDVFHHREGRYRKKFLELVDQL